MRLRLVIHKEMSALTFEIKKYFIISNLAVIRKTDQIPKFTFQAAKSLKPGVHFIIDADYKGTHESYRSFVF